MTEEEENIIQLSGVETDKDAERITGRGEKKLRKREGKTGPGQS